MDKESIEEVFDTKYEEFAKDLEGACPELAAQIAAAVKLDTEERKTEFKRQVLKSCSPKRDSKTCPSFVLPGVAMPQELWEKLSSRTKKAIQEYLTVLSFTFLIDSGTSGDVEGGQWTAEWAKSMLNDMQEKMKNVDFAGLTEKIAGLFGSGDGMPQLPEKFLKGQIAKLAEEIVKEFNMDDFGIDPEKMKEAGNDPSKALNMIMEVFMKNPRALQGTVGKLTKKIQQKIQSGAIRPQELVAEAEELMKTFSDNPQFVNLMESFRQSFGADDPEVARATGREPENRLSIVKARLRKKLEENKAKGKR